MITATQLIEDISPGYCSACGCRLIMHMSQLNGRCSIHKSWDCSRTDRGLRSQAREGDRLALFSFARDFFRPRSDRRLQQSSHTAAASALPSERGRFKSHHDSSGSGVLEQWVRRHVLLLEVFGRMRGSAPLTQSEGVSPLSTSGAYPADPERSPAGGLPLLSWAGVRMASVMFGGLLLLVVAAELAAAWVTS